MFQDGRELEIFPGEKKRDEEDYEACGDVFLEG